MIIAFCIQQVDNAQRALGVLSVFSIVKGGPNTDAAKLFVDFLTSTEGQAFFRDADYIPVDPKVPPLEPSLRPDGKTLKMKYFTPAEVDENLPAFFYNQMTRPGKHYRQRQSMLSVVSPPKSLGS